MTTPATYVTETDRVEVFKALAALSNNLPAPESVSFHGGNWISLRFATAPEVLAWAQALRAEKQWLRLHYGDDSQTYYTGTWLGSHLALNCIEKGHLDAAGLEAVNEVPDDRIEEILAALNSFVVYEVEPYTEIVNGVSVLKQEVVGADSNLDKAIDWALDQPEVSSTGGPDGNGAEVVLRDGTVIEFDPLDKAWSVVVSDESAGVAR